MLEDRRRDLVYVPVAAPLLRASRGWSEPVRYRFEGRGPDADPELVFEVCDEAQLEAALARRRADPAASVEDSIAAERTAA